jgi:hypothetical protein
MTWIIISIPIMLLAIAIAIAVLPVLLMSISEARRDFHLERQRLTAEPVSSAKSGYAWAGTAGPLDEVAG